MRAAGVEVTHWGRQTDPFLSGERSLSDIGALSHKEERLQGLMNLFLGKSKLSNKVVHAQAKLALKNL